MLYVGYVLEKLLDVNAIIVRPLYSCTYSGLRYTNAIIRGNDLCFTISPRGRTGICALCSVLIKDVIILFPRQICVLYVIR